MHAPTIPDLTLEVRDLPETRTAAVRVTRTPADLADAFAELLPLIAARVAELGGVIAGPPYARYHAVTADAVDVEIGAPVLHDVPGLPLLDPAKPREIGSSALPAGRVATVVHVGPYGRLGETWGRLDGLLAERGLVGREPGWEAYVDDPMVVAPDTLRTEILIPIA